MKKYFKIAFVAAGIAIASFSSLKKAHATAVVAFGDCVGNGDCGKTSSGTALYGKWHEPEQE
jgi:hypothetical protein